jgi:hypothetical protein
VCRLIGSTELDRISIHHASARKRAHRLHTRSAEVASYCGFLRAPLLIEVSGVPPGLQIQIREELAAHECHVSSSDTWTVRFAGPVPVCVRWASLLANGGVWREISRRSNRNGSGSANSMRAKSGCETPPVVASSFAVVLKFRQPSRRPSGRKRDRYPFVPHSAVRARVLPPRSDLLHSN